MDYKIVYQSGDFAAMQYDFTSCSDEKAVEFAKNKVSVDNKVLINLDTCEDTYIGDADACERIIQNYLALWELHRSGKINSLEEEIEANRKLLGR